jgi:hypothetical protein
MPLLTPGCPTTPKPVRVTTDPEGAFQSAEFRDFLAQNDIEYTPTAGEAHWQLDVERKDSGHQADSRQIMY